MKPEQAERLIAMQERLVDLFLEEVNPQTLPGAGIAITAQDRATRGDAYWCKRSAAASIMLASRITSYLCQQADLTFRSRRLAAADPDEVPDGPIQPDPVDDIERDIGRYEREAQKLTAKFLEKAAGRVGQA